jgi:ABC-type multidrug transport system fused ATPase/permease subunit
VVLQDGLVAERGTDAELRAAGGAYRMLRASGLG